VNNLTDTLLNYQHFNSI